MLSEDSIILSCYNTDGYEWGLRIDENNLVTHTNGDYNIEDDNITINKRLLEYRLLETEKRIKALEDKA